MQIDRDIFKQARLRAGLSPEQLEEVSGVSATVIRGIEGRPLRPATEDALRAALGIHALDDVTGPTVRAARLREGLSIEQLSLHTRRIGRPVGETTLRNLEGRDHQAATVKALADALEVDVLDLELTHDGDDGDRDTAAA